MGSLGQAIAEAIKERGWEATLEQHRAFSRWEEVVGPYLAKHCRPEKVKRGTLYLSTDSQAWRNELSFQKDDILLAINRGLNPRPIKDIRFL